MVVFNYRFSHAPYVEIRYVRPNLGGSYPILGLYASSHSAQICFMKLFFIFGISKPLKSAPLSKEEEELVKKLIEEEDAT